MDKRLYVFRDGNIRYFEYENDKFEYLSEYKSGDPQRGVAFLPKRGVNTHENEVMRAFKTVNDSYIEPVSFIVPRRAEVFQGDIYPPVVGAKPAMSSSEWFDGMEGFPPKIDLESIYEGGEPAEVPGSSKLASRIPSLSTTASPAKVQSEPVKEPAQPSAAALRGPLPSMKEQTSSIANLASKFNDKEESSSEAEDDSSSFEEVPKPIERHAPSNLATKHPEPAKVTSASPAKSTSFPSPTKQSPLNLPVKAATASPQSATAPILAPSTITSSKAADSMEQVTLQEIKGMLESQNKTIYDQSEKIERLVGEVERLKAAITESE